MILGKFSIYWRWHTLFRKDWYSGNRLKYPNNADIKPKYHFMFDFGALTVALQK